MSDLEIQEVQSLSALEETMIGEINQNIENFIITRLNSGDFPLKEVLKPYEEFEKFTTHIASTVYNIHSISKLQEGEKYLLMESLVDFMLQNDLSHKTLCKGISEDYFDNNLPQTGLMVKTLELRYSVFRKIYKKINGKDFFAHTLDQKNIGLLNTNSKTVLEMTREAILQYRDNICEELKIALPKLKALLK